MDNSIIITKATNYFTNSEPSTCPLTECKLMNQDCQSSYIGNDYRVYPGGDFDILVVNKI